MRKFLKMLGLSGLFILQTAWSQQVVVNQDSLKVGFVNVRQLMARAPQLEQIQKDLATEFEKENQQIITLRNEIAKLSLRYDQKSEEGLVALQKTISAKQKEILRLQQSLQDAYNLKRNELLAKLQTLIVRMIAKVSQEKQLDLVLNNTGVVYVSGRIDITPAVFSYLEVEQIK